ncbi:ABC transporter permease [Lyngbya confervoides]|uniref:ABC transporter permease n=1 Tax=Lyngbya confervoides BDU141951 TaxID=1574623 RepID=A0ABD4T9A6_9CYAN|nr:ABC transporter permease subunit [Lyngbya confervoides]MCM1985368.1 ABC transporter permease [Lyngbya confervoides BDU141951]
MKIIVANILAIYRRELSSYFKSPLAYIIAGVFWFLLGSLLVTIILRVSEQVANIEIQRQLSAANESIDAPNWILQYFFSTTASIVLGILPLLTMNLYTEERKRGTLELLATSPITNWSVAVGKLGAVLSLFIALLLPIMGLELVALSASDPAMSFGVFWLGHLGLVLMAAAILALGLFISSLTDNAIVAAVITYALVLLLFLIDSFATNIPGVLGEMLTHLSLLKHFTTLTQGILSGGSIALFLSYILLGIFLTAQSVDLFRFQQ